jgi:hypothetical protein
MDMNKAKAHQRYRDKSEKIVPGVTTIPGILNKPALVKWANNLGLQGIDSSKYVDETAQIGTLAHYLIECWLKSIDPDLSDYSPNQITPAVNAVQKFHNWRENNKFEVIESETMLVSEKKKFGGAIDCYCLLNGKKTLLDFKTSKAIYPEHQMQASAYEYLLVDNGRQVEDVRILRIGRDETEGFEDFQIVNRKKLFKVFNHCLAIYNLKKELKA